MYQEIKDLEDIIAGKKQPMLTEPSESTPLNLNELSYISSMQQSSGVDAQIDMNSIKTENSK
jgi:hypothetical protein